MKTGLNDPLLEGSRLKVEAVSIQQLCDTIDKNIDNNCEGLYDSDILELNELIDELQKEEEANDVAGVPVDTSRSPGSASNPAKTENSEKAKQGERSKTSEIKEGGDESISEDVSPKNNAQPSKGTRASDKTDGGGPKGSKIEDETGSKNLEEISNMALETYIDELKGIKGFIAAAIMSFTGEVLASYSTTEAADLEIVGATFNDIFRSAHEASGKVDLEACQEMVIRTPKGIIVMNCSGVDAKAHFHTLGILDADGNQALMKMNIQKMLPKIMKELA